MWKNETPTPYIVTGNIKSGNYYKKQFSSLLKLSRRTSNSTLRYLHNSNNNKIYISIPSLAEKSSQENYS